MNLSIDKLPTPLEGSLELLSRQVGQTLESPRSRVLVSKVPELNA